MALEELTKYSHTVRLNDIKRPPAYALGLSCREPAGHQVDHDRLGAAIPAGGKQLECAAVIGSGMASMA
jgi:hypothetical protein